MDNLQSIIYLFGLYLLLLILENIDTIKHYTYCLINPRNCYSIPLNKTLINNVDNIIRNIKDYKDYTFIDFGSGYGNILYYFKDTFNKLIGIELSTESHNEAKNLLQNYNNISLLNMSMEDFEFPNTDIILYMYEPLFELKCNDRNILYKKIIKKLSKSNNKVYILYIRANMISNILDKCVYNKELFEEDFKLIDEKNTCLWPLNRMIYILEN